MISPSPRKGPRPGDIFRNYHYTAETIIELEPGTASPHPKVAKRKLVSGRARAVDIWDLEDAVRAEVVLEYWGGHVGTSDHKLRVNRGAWIAIPQIEGTPTDPLRTMRNLMGSTAIPIPLEQISLGLNSFEFTCGPQLPHGNTWGIFKIYAFTVRIYYNETKARPDGRIISPRPGQVVADNPEFEAAVSGAKANDAKLEFTSSDVTRVDFVGLYTDFNWEGDGVDHQWHYQLEQGQLQHHIGTATRHPFRVQWDTGWIPDQEKPVSLAAFVIDTHGITYMTEAVDVRLRRPQRSVKMFAAANIPEYFAVRIGNCMGCDIELPVDPAQAVAARLFLSTWAGGHADSIRLNETQVVERVGRNDYFSYDSLEVDPRILRRGSNRFSILSHTVHHSAEINWPGPVLMLEFPKP
jgi:hypothetical protein